MAYDHTWESVSTHRVPAWYDDAKLGVFLHWGLYSVPGWAPQVPDIQELMRTQGPEGLLRNNPYAEWYLNSMRIEDSPTWQHQRDAYGPDATYDDFRPEFDAATAAADLDALARTCQLAGARYVVLTTKHHDGFTLWPARSEHPRKGRYHARRDLVAGVVEAVRAQGMRMGLYYSGGYDWPYNDALLQNPADAMLAVPDDPSYADYAEGHVRELMERFAPSVLWNDVCWPAGTDLAGLFADYYDAVPDGVINDRWLQPTMKRGAVPDALMRGVGTIVQALWRHVPESSRSLTFPSAHHFDFNTPEYQTFDEIRADKWEATRGVGHSFGANRNERPQDIVTTTELVRSFCDIVSKNGNLLIGIGPRPDGVVQEEQVAPLAGLGAWLEINGEALFGSRPWVRADGTASDGTSVRFTQQGGRTYALLLATPSSRRLRLQGVDLGHPGPVRMLGVSEPLDVAPDGTITLPAALPVAPAHVLDLGGAVRPGAGS